MAGFGEVREAARGRWAGVLAALGVNSALLVNKHGPCPGCGGKDRFRYDDQDGSGSFICSQGGGGNLAGDGFDLLAHVHDWGRAKCLREVAGQVGVYISAGAVAEYSRNSAVAPEPAAPEEKKRKPYDAVALGNFARGCPEIIDREWLAARSPVRVEWGVRDGLGADFLSYLYMPGEVVLVFHNYYSQGDFCWWNGRTFRLAKQQGVKATPSKLPVGGAKGIWYLTNPVTGKWVAQPGGKVGRRHGGCVTAFRYAVLESDDAPADLWLRALVQLEVPIAAIYTSGGSSIHALVRVDCRSHKEFDVCRDMLVSVLSKIGADPGAISGVRLSRLPGCWRGNVAQELWYLDPRATWGSRLIDRQPRRGGRNAG